MAGVTLLVEADDKASAKIRGVEAAQSKLTVVATKGNAQIGKAAEVSSSKWAAAGRRIGQAADVVKTKINAAGQATMGFARRIEKDFKSLAAVTAFSGLALAGQIHMIQGWTHEASVQEVAVKKLEASLHAEQRTRQDSIKVLTDQADALQMVTTFADDQTIAMQAQLAGFNLTTDQILRLTPRVLDLATFLEKATGETVDLQGVTLALGRAINGDAGSLTRYGVSIKLAAGETMTFDRLLEGLSRHAGLAEERAKSFSGVMARFANQTSDAKEALGRALIPAITEVVLAITPAIVGFGKWADAHHHLIAWIVGGGAAGAGLIAALGAVALAISQLPALIAVATGPIGILAFALMSVGTAAFLARKRIYEVPSSLENVNADIAKTTKYLEDLREHEKKLMSRTVNVQQIWAQATGGMANDFIEVSKRIKEAEERLAKLGEAQKRIAAQDPVGPPAPIPQSAEEVHKKEILRTLSDQKKFTADWLSARLEMIAMNYAAEVAEAEKTGSSISELEAKRLEDERTARLEHERALRDMQAWRLKVGLRKPAEGEAVIQELGVAPKIAVFEGPPEPSLKAEREAWRKLEEEKRALSLETLSKLTAADQAWLETRISQIDDNYRREVQLAEGNAATIAQLKIDRDAEVMEARIAHEEAYMEKWVENNEILMMGIEAYGNAYDAVVDLMIAKEENAARIREAIFGSFRRSFIGGTAKMFKAWVSEQLKASILGDAIARKSTASRKVAEAKVGAVKAYQAFAGIPIIGPALGAAAAAAAFAFLVAFRRGGEVPGVRTGRDTVAARLEPKEYVLQRTAAERIGRPVLDHMNRTGRIPLRVVEHQPVIAREILAGPASSGRGGSLLEINFHLNAGRGRGRDLELLRDRIVDEVVPVLEDLMQDGNMRGDLEPSRPLARKRVA